MLPSLKITVDVTRWSKAKCVLIGTTSNIPWNCSLRFPINTKIYYTYLLILCNHTWNSFCYQMRAEGRGGGIPDVRIALCIFFSFMWWKGKIRIFRWLPEGIFFRIGINLLTGHPFSTAQRDFAEMGIASSDMLRDFLIEIFFLLQLTNLEKKFALILF